MQKALTTMEELVNWFNQLDNPVLAITCHGYKMSPLVNDRVIISNDRMSITVEPTKYYRKDQLAKASIDTCGYLDVPHSPTITVAVQFPIALPLDLTPENLIPFIEKTVRDYSGNTIDFIAIDDFNSDRLPL